MTDTAVQTKPTDDTGLTSAAAASRLKADGPNAMPETADHPLKDALSKFWSPVPWLLEASIILQLVLHKYVESGIIAALLIFNAVLAFVQEGRAQATVAALRSRLALNASVRRDGRWLTIPATDLVVGDTIKLSLGQVVAADVRLTDGSVSLDQSMLTGESLPIDAGTGKDTFAGTMVVRGEATAEVTATGNRTKFGRTAELVRTAHVVSSQQKAVLLIVRNIAIFDTIVITLIGIYAYFHAMPWSETIPLILTSILAAIPVALPATFTMASAIGAKALTKLSVLPTRLSAVDEAGTIDVLCADKTGTLTRNLLSVSVVHPMPGFTSAQVLELAALASSDGGQDPVDSAIRLASSQKPIPNALRRTNFIPFDPEKKTSAATATDSNGAVQQIIKGAFESVNNVTTPSPDAAGVADELQKQGLRVLAVASGPKSLQIVGLIALSDQPRDDSAALVKELTTLGVRTVMITGDAAPTAEIVAKAVGLSGTTFPSGSVPTHLDPDKYSVFAGVVPEGKFDIVKAFQQEGYSVGMCGDGANDAPALRQAQIGIAVSTATDVAKSAAGVVLITPGLSGIVAAIKEGRITFQRILNYTINSVIKKLVQLLLLAIGLIMTGHAVLTPLLMVIVMITGDFLAMSLTTDNVEPSTKANTWQIGKITASSAVLALCFLAFCLTVVAFGKFRLGLGTAEIQTLAVVSIVFGSQATIYAIRGHHTLFGRRPTIWLVLTSAIDVSIISTLAACGILMAPIPVALITAVLIGAIGLCLVEEFVKLPVFARLGIP